MKPKVIRTRSPTGKKKLHLWEPSRGVFVIERDGQFFNPMHRGWCHTPKLYKRLHDATRAVAVHNLGKVTIKQYLMTLKGVALYESYPDQRIEHYGKVRTRQIG